MNDHESRLVYHPDFHRYDFGPQHPLRPERLTLGLELLETTGVWDPARQTLSAPHIDVSALERVHASSYVRAVHDASGDALGEHVLRRYGLGAGDTPAFPEMHAISSTIVGGSVTAARAIMDGAIKHAFNPGGGWHHALRDRASGFCVYNDIAVAARVMTEDYGARVLYADFDCHHGDGVQWIFYEDPSVMTVSFHESGRFLFPGTGEVDEVGRGAGYGYSVNMPFAPFTQDDSWLHAVSTLLPHALERFRPDVLITAHGADTHILDPLTHLALTTRSFAQQAALAHELAHAYTEGRWLAVGSGGYDWRRVVPRSWAILWAEMTGGQLPSDLPREWIDTYDTVPEEPMVGSFGDAESLGRSLPRRDETDASNERTLRLALEATGLVGSGAG